MHVYMAVDLVNLEANQNSYYCVSATHKPLSTRSLASLLEWFLQVGKSSLFLKITSKASKCHTVHLPEAMDGCTFSELSTIFRVFSCTPAQHFSPMYCALVIRQLLAECIKNSTKTPGAGFPVRTWALN